jgi:hypothetical protein
MSPVSLSSNGAIVRCEVEFHLQGNTTNAQNLLGPKF